MFYIALGVLCLVLLVGHRLIGSPFGKVLQAIRNNPERARAIGYPVRRVQIVVFVISAMLTSLAGILFVMTNRFVSPTVLNYQLSIEVLIVSIIGGPQSLLGPVLGAAFLIGIEDMVRGFAEFNTMLIGVVFIFVVMFVPEGIYGRLKG
jgi:branched-chain amino acid transport system permease protein